MADEIRRLIRVRTRKGATFKRDGFGKKKQLSASWRKPRGQHSKQREQKKAKGALPKPGFGSPVAVRGMHPSGFFEVLVHTTGDLEGLNPKTQAIRIASTVGSRKRAGIQDKAISAGLRVLNAKAAKPAQKPVQKAAKTEEKAKKPKPKKAAAQKTKPASKKKKEPQKEKKEAVKEAKEKVSSKTQEKAKAAPADEPKPKKEPKQKASKAKADAGAEQKPKKTVKSKAEPAKEAKTTKKAASKPAAKPRKKTSTGVKGNE